MEESGAPAKASVSKVTDDAVDGVAGSMPEARAVRAQVAEMWRTRW